MHIRIDRLLRLYHDWFPQDQAWSKYRPGVLKLVPEDLYFTFDHYKHGPQHGQQHAANSYLSLVSRIFSRWYCAVLRERIKSGDLEAALDLAMHLFHNYPEESGDAAFWMVWCIRQNHIPALYFAATSYDRELKLSLQTKRMYLTCVAESGDPKYAESARETLAIMDLEAAEQRKLRQMAREFQESQRQAQVNAQMDAVRKKLDTAEWKLSFLLTGDASTMEERILRGELSDTQILGYNLLRSDIEHRARKAISNQLHA